MDSKIKSILNRGVQDIIVRESVEKKLSSGKKLRIKHGVDPTTTDLHLGYASIYLKLKELQELGHTIIFLIGDFTARFGDPTEKLKTRILRPKEEVNKLAENYISQVGKIIDLEKAEVRRNSEWYENMRVEDFLKIMSKFTVPRLLERDMFQKRLNEGGTIQLHEITYPVLQGYDSIMLKSELTVIGSDQIFNELQARVLNEDSRDDLQDIIAMRLLVGTDGIQKMSQSLGNYISFNDAPKDMFGKIMSIPDSSILDYFELLTRVSLEDIKDWIQKNPMDAKLKLATEVVSIFYRNDLVKDASEYFNEVVRNKKTPSNMPEILIKNNMFDLIEIIRDNKITKSKSEARRLVASGAVSIDSKKVLDLILSLENGEHVLKVGPRRFYKLIIEK